MPVNINEFKVFCEFVSNKVQQGGTITPAQFNILANQAQMVKFEADRNIYITTGEITKFLAFFLKTKVSQASSQGTIPFPNDWQHTVSMRSYYVRPNGNSVEVEIDEVKNRSWGEVQISSLLKPTKRFPKYIENADYYKFLPKNLGSVTISYLGTPKKPFWNFTVVNGRAVYDPIGSIDYEWDSFAMNEVAANYLQLIGVNIKDLELLQFSQQFKQESKASL